MEAESVSVKCIVCGKRVLVRNGSEYGDIKEHVDQCRAERPNEWKRGKK